MGRARKIDDDVEEDDDRLPPRRGRPAPEVFGPPKPEAHQREAYARRLQSILDTLEISDLGRDERMYLQRTLWRPDRLRQFDPKRFAVASGEDQVVLLLRSIAETANGIAALKLPIITALSSCLHDVWTGRGLEFLEAMDKVPLLEIQTTLRELGLEDRLENAIRWRLTQILGPPVAAQPKPPKPAREPIKTPPPGVTNAGWEAALAIHKANRLRRAKSRPAARMAA
jgi:hypothetical protein